MAALALSCTILLGLLPPAKAFAGFSNPIIVIIGSVLVLSRGVSATGVVDAAMRRLMRLLRSTSLQVLVLASCVTLLSALMKNVGALGLFLPSALQAAERSGRPPSRYLMPLAFGSLIGGTITLVGTSPNLLISTVRQQIEGRPFGFLDFAPVGLPLSLLAVAFLSVAWRLLPERKGEASAERRFSVEDYTTEVLLPANSPLAGKTVADLERLSEGEVSVTAIVREGDRRYVPSAHWTLYVGDVLVLQGDAVALKPLVDSAGLELLGAAAMRQTASGAKDDELETVEAVVTANTAIVGASPETLRLRQRYEVNLLAISRGGQQILSRLRSNRFQVGDVVVVQGRRRQLTEAITLLGLLPLAGRDLALGQATSRWLPLLILSGTLGVIVAGVLRVEAAFFVAAVLMVLLRLITPRQAYDSLDGSLLVMLACLIPVGEVLETTGASRLIAKGLADIAVHLPGIVAVGLLFVLTMLVTPFLHHAAAVIVIGPVAASVAKQLGFGPDAFLMAVALGASCDFLTPIGHQNNLLVMGPGGYRFADYWRLGLPLSIIVAVAGTALIVLRWGL